MRILASGDHHFDEHSPRFSECQRVHAWMVEVAREEGIDLFLSSGDIYERASTPLERHAVAGWLAAMADVCPVVVAKGNHDRHLDCELLGRLRTRHPVIVEERAAVHRVADVAVAAVAWPDRAYLLAACGSQEATNNAMREALQDLLRGLGSELAEHNGPRILLGHFMVDGSVTSTGQPLLGQPINVGLADLALAGAQLGVMGHIHKVQSFDVNGGPHHYTGSPYRTDFGQLERKTILFAEFDGDSLAGVREIETPAARMVHLAGEFADGQLRVDELHYPSGAEVRVRYRVAPDAREAASRQAAELADSLRAAGAVSVKVEEQIIVEHRARAPEVAKAQSLRDKLDAYWASIGFDPGDRRESLLRKAAWLEEEVRDAA